MIGTILSILAALGLFLFIIFIHELGHFLAAKWSKIRVSEFAIGMGPKIFSWGKGETKYSLRAIPLGGFCSMAEDEEADEADPRAFRNKPVHKRFITIAAGAIFNILLGFILMATFVTIDSAPNMGALETPINTNRIAGFRDWANSDYDGLQEGDRITHVNGTRIFTANDIVLAAMRHGEENEQTFRIVRDGRSAEIELMFGQESITTMEWIGDDNSEGFMQGDQITRVNNRRFTDVESFDSLISEHFAQNIDDGVQTSENPLVIRVARGEDVLDLELTTFVGRHMVEFEIGEPIYLPPRLDFYVGGQGKNPWTISREATGQTVSMVRWIYVSLIDLVTGNVASDEIAGPVGVIDQTAQAARMGGGMLLFWMGILSINLGVINLLPIPALDGARLVFLGIEGIRRKPIKPEREGVVHLVGFVILIGLILLLTFNDIIRIFGGS